MPRISVRYIACTSKYMMLFIRFARINESSPEQRSGGSQARNCEKQGKFGRQRWNSSTSVLADGSAPTPDTERTRRATSSGTERVSETAERSKRAKGSAWVRVGLPRDCHYASEPRYLQDLPRSSRSTVTRLEHDGSVGRSAPGPRLRARYAPTRVTRRWTSRSRCAIPRGSTRTSRGRSRRAAA